MEPSDLDMPLFRKQLQRYLSDERARFMARAEIVDDLTAQAIQTTGVGNLVIPPGWRELIVSLLKLGLDDVGLALLIRTLHKELRGTPTIVSARKADGDAC